MDMDVVLGRVTSFLSEPTVDVLCPMWPNGYHLLTWGPFTAFRRASVLRARHTNRTASGDAPFRLSASWRAVLTQRRHFAFEELAFSCGGRECQLGMSNVLDEAHCQNKPVHVYEIATPSTWTNRTLRFDASGLYVAGGGDYAHTPALLLHLHRAKNWTFHAGTSSRCTLDAPTCICE